MNKIAFALLSSAVMAGSLSASAETIRIVDLEKPRLAYVAATNEAAKAVAAWEAEQRAWRDACAAAKKAKKDLPPQPTAKRPTHPNWIRSPFVYPWAEIRADEAYAAELATLEARQKAWDAADPKTRARWRPGNPRRTVKVEPGDECGLGVPQDVKLGGGARLVLPVPLSRPGEHVFWIRHWRDADRRTALEFLLRSPDGECVKYELPDRFFDLWEDTHASNRVFGVEAKAGWVWTKVPVEIEYPGDYRLWLAANSRYVQRGQEAKPSRFAVADAWVTDDLAADPEKKPLAEERVPLCYEAPKGFVKAKYHAPHAMMNSSIEDPQKRPPTNFMECYSWFGDPVRLLKYGQTDGLWMVEPIGKEAIARGDTLDRKDYEGGYSVGGSVQVNADASRKVDEILAKKYPFDKRKPVGPGNEPVGRAQWQDGSWGGWSNAFEEYNELYLEENKKAVQDIMANNPAYKNAFCWWTAWEQCGSYDYGPTSVAGFRRYLKDFYGTIEKLNAGWRTEYGSFDDITPGYWKYVFGKERLEDPLAWHRNAANFIRFREFCSKCYATRVAQKTRAVRAFDKKTHISSNLSCNNISSVMWMQWRPLIFEDTAQITMAGSDMIGYDIYGTDDLCGANYELFDCFGDGKLRPMVREGAIHAPSPELQARSQWHNVAQGMQGQACFCVQEANVGELSKFGMTDMFHGAVPRPKIAAISDNFRALHQLEYLVSETKRTRAVKPVAIYYSATCNLLYEKPSASIFDCGPDNFFRVYELLHANGYDVTFVTDRQIREGGDWLKSIGAIVFVDATYIPLDVQEKVMDWVRAGGSILADSQSGSCDDHTYPTDGFTKFLGIRPVRQKKVDAMAAEKLAFGYSAYSFDVIDRDELYKTACEVKDAPGGTHPISRALVKTMFSAMGYNEVQCVKGTQVLQENNGRPYMVVRDEGKGKVAYFAGYLGTMYGAGCTKYEWTDAHADDSPYRVMAAWADWAGLRKVAVNDLPKDLAYGLRFESPLVDAKGNAMLGIVSQLRGSVPSFRVKYVMPENFKAPKLVLGSVNASRKLVKLPFAYDERTRELSVRMCGFRCWGNVLALNEIGPFVSVEQVGGRRDAYGLGWFRPGDEVEYRATVYNPCGDRLADGEVELRLSEGWFYDREKAAVGEIPAYGASEPFAFRVKAPAWNSCRKLEPVNFIYRGMRHHLLSPNEKTVSSPAVEMVWFQKEPQKAPAPEFGVE